MSNAIPETANLIITFISVGFRVKALNSFAIEATKSAEILMKAPKLIIKPRLKVITSGVGAEKCSKAAPNADKDT